MPIKHSSEGMVATITIDRPEKLNALDAEHLHSLRDAIARHDADPQIRVLVLTGAGQRAFSAGADLSAPTSRVGAVEAFGYDLAASSERGLYVRLLDLAGLSRRKPLIAAVNGYCLGGGLELALQCDMIVASSNAKFGLPEVSVGSVPGAGGVSKLLRAIPKSAAMHMLLTAGRIDADRAFALGLASAVWPQDVFAAEVTALAAKIADMGPLAIQLVKMLADQYEGLSHAQNMQLTELTWALLRDTADRAEGKRAFAEKRKPSFQGR